MVTGGTVVLWPRVVCLLSIFQYEGELLVPDGTCFHNKIPFRITNHTEDATRHTYMHADGQTPSAVFADSRLEV